MLAMDRIAANSIVSSPRRFILLPEDSSGGKSQGRRIRRYQLTSLGHGADRGRLRLGAGFAAASGVHELGRAGSL
jgi:hypothetical protein